MSTRSSQSERPAWVVPLGIIALVLIVVFISWKVMSGSTPPSAGDTAKEVRPGMYDFRKAAEQGTLGRRPGTEGSTNP